MIRIKEIYIIVHSLSLTMLFPAKHSGLTDNDSLRETGNVCSCGNLSLIKVQ